MVKVLAKKTLKREFASIGVFLPFLLLVAMTAWTGDATVRLQLIQTLWLPVMTLVGGAFGLDHFKKQSPDPEPTGFDEPYRGEPAYTDPVPPQ